MVFDSCKTSGLISVFLSFAGLHFSKQTSNSKQEQAARTGGVLPLSRLQIMHNFLHTERQRKQQNDWPVQSQFHILSMIPPNVQFRTRMLNLPTPEHNTNCLSSAIHVEDYRARPNFFQKCGKHTLPANSSDMTVIHRASTKKM